MDRERVPLFRVHMPAEASEAVGRVLLSGRLTEGAEVRAFEERLADWLGTPYVLAVSDVSAAVQLGLFLAGVRPGSEVIVPPMVCTAVTMPIANLWAKPAWADVDAETGMLDPDDVPRRASERTKAVLFSHWSGDVAEVERLGEVARALGVRTVEDASNAFGAQVRGRAIGSGTADFTAFSFRATKQLNTGEGGALVCRRAEDYEQARWLRRYGIHQTDFRLPNGDLNPASDIPVAGWSFPMTNIAAAIGLAQWPHKDEILGRTRENGAFFDRELAGIPGLTRLRRRADATSAFWTYSFLAERRSDLVDALVKDGIGSQRLHTRNDVYSCFEGSGRPHLPGTDAFDERTISIPCGWWVGPRDRERIVGRLRAGW